MTVRRIPAILIVDDEVDFRETVAEKLGLSGYRVKTVGDAAAALAAVREEHFAVALVDIRMPGMDGLALLRALREAQPVLEVLMVTGHGTIETAVEAMRAGAHHFLTKPVKLAELEVAVQKALEKGRLAKDSLLRRQERAWSRVHGDIVGGSAAIRDVLSIVERVAPSDSTVLVEGETGTGKELVANAIHQGSARREEPFVVVNCAALSESLLEAELFGHEKGAYTGAAGARAGLFEVADRGTLFLDEIGEMAPSGQAKLLRVLETGRFRRLGDSRETEVDVRVLAATNRRLDDAVAQGRFREDLFHRLNVVRIVVPPLRDRREDIPLLAEHFLLHHARPGAGRKRLSPATLDALMSYAWPGNVRELSNLLERAVLLCVADELTPEYVPLPRGGRASPAGASVGAGAGPAFGAVPPIALPPVLPLPAAPAGAGSAASAQPAGEAGLPALREAESRYIARVLTACRWDKAQAAHILGITTRHLYRKIKKYRLSEGP
ncbi:MAG: sigma-54-dependent Fis family transcriptional regulator [Planctomycetes bacterium]|nr:sigma-54-dependent Fis family transcriptional regulator [Planctomycetota bacterium]